MKKFFSLGTQGTIAGVSLFLGVLVQLNSGAANLATSPLSLKILCGIFILSFGYIFITEGFNWLIKRK